MRSKIYLILNASSIVADVYAGMVLLDYIRYHAGLKGTKIGCREGACGACTVLVGELVGDQVVYQNVNSCLMPMGNVDGKHVVTIEGVSAGRGVAGTPNPIQAAFVEEGATQCGFCTPGFIVSLAGHCLDRGDPIAAIGGNICRCTGYKSIERAVARMAEDLSEADDLEGLIATGFLPSWMQSIPPRLRELRDENPLREAAVPVGGGTDLFVQRPEELETEWLRFNLQRSDLRDIQREGNTIVVGASVTMEQLNRDVLMLESFPDLPRYMKLVASQAIRNQATISGNLANASPIGDTTVFFLALGASVTLRLDDRHRTVRLRDFYRGYKDVDLRDYEEIIDIRFEIPEPGTFFHFEKVSKRTHLDIATVNAAASVVVDRGIISRAHVAVGGVAPIPLYLDKTSAFLASKPVDVRTVTEAAAIGDSEIAPISDVRGSADYKRLLFRQLFFAVFLESFGEVLDVEELGLCSGQAEGGG